VLFQLGQFRHPNELALFFGQRLVEDFL